MKKKRQPPASQTVREYRALQRLMATAVMRPLNGADGMQKRWVDGRLARRVAAGFIKPNDRMSSFARLEIYNRQYWFRVRDSFYEDYPGLRAVLGEAKFARLADDYLARHPSQSYTLRNLGSRLVKFLAAQPPRALPRKSLALDLARLEWAHIEAFDNASRRPLKPGALAGRHPARLTLRLQPHLTLLRLRHEVADFLIELKRGTGLRTEASNAMEQGRSAAPVGPARMPRGGINYLAVHRHRNAVYYKRLDSVQFRLLTAMQKGATIEAACGKLTGVRLPPNLGETIRDWFETWARLGWFCELDEV